MPIADYQAAAQTLVQFLKLLTTTGRLRLRYRIVAGAGAADPDGLEAREIYVNLSGPDAALLVERNGELLRAMEHIAAKLVGLESEEHDKVSFDADNFKALRAAELKGRARAAVDAVERTGEPYPLPPTNSRERRLMHLALKAFPQVGSESVGEGAERVLVVFPHGYDRAGYQPPPAAALERRDRGFRPHQMGYQHARDGRRR